VARKDILIACEYSGAVREAFRKLGHDAYSCDLLPADDGSFYHFATDAVAVIKRHEWDAVIAFPPCTHLAASGARWFPEKIADGRQASGIAFFMAMVEHATAHVPFVAVENPVGIMSTQYRKPDQIIQPWQFGHGETKATCLWLKGLPKLVPTDVVAGREQRIWKMGPSPDRWKERSKTFQGIADAMATQWAPVIEGGL